MNYHKKLTIILISYKSEQKIYSFIKKIPKDIKVIIIENSNNILLKKNVEKKYKNIKVIIKKNEGVSASINHAVNIIKTEYFLQISPDVIFNYKSLRNFFDLASKLNNNFSAIGPRFLNVRSNTHKQINKNLETGSIDSIHGSCMFINKKKFNEIGKFDKKFFLYFEETDYCRRAMNKKIKSYQINSVRVKTQGRSVLIENKKSKKKLDNILIWHFIWSKYYFTKKKYGNLISLLIFMPIILRILIRIFLNKVFYNEEKLEKYKYRLSGLISSIIGKSSSLRP